MNPVKQIRVILVEDDTDLRESLVEALAIYGYPVTGVGSGLAFYREVGRREFDVAIIDLGLPDVDGYELVEFSRRNSSAGVIVVTARGEVTERIKGYVSGADLYLVKPVDASELAAAIASIAARRRAATTTPGKSDGWRLAQDSWQLITPDGRESQLSQREFLLLSTLADCTSQPVSRELLYLKVYGRESDGVSSSTLDSLVSRLRSRYRELYDKQLPLQTVAGSGYRFAGELSVI